ncbi:MULTISPECIES: family 16 glycosylhydrolase [unclassified Lentimicrobium]|uniref:family 16 glycosylhydrolase n=1 Tax=unclassified Lentimicrobium TaxID=2677434 RepID=UPI0015553E35|nr:MULTISPECIES: family 16 glycosylhydrolase [unclassified Lentimicrobium]NPD47508.1 family 16 glycosylhydrolase [Lentimicrobium sp. S6]NPD84681.1 family 16 glycosylhydrolase [Lentimicrobium sp. L6]
MKILLKFSLFLMFSTLIFMSCDKKEESDFTAGFTFDYINDNTVYFNNTSSGEYYSLTWDFGNGDIITTTDKKESFQIHYALKGDYTVSLKVLNYNGTTKTASDIIVIDNSNLPNLNASFTATPTQSNPNYVLLTNTTEGEFDSFKWLYRDQIIANEDDYLAHFPLAGDYEIELQIIRGEDVFTSTQSIIIDEDDQGEPNLIWSEEFDYTGLPDASYWNMETGGGGWGNNELQNYTNREDNALVGNGYLTITAKEEVYGGRNYTSARITTQNKFDFKYGKIEARIKLPYGQGIWPAFWMLGSNINSVSWPACGEIDIMELVGGTNRDNISHSTIHWDNAGQHASYGESYSLSNGIFADDFHVFSVEWDEQSIRGFVDGSQYFVADITPSGLSEFHEDFFIILNLAVGGNWPGSPNASTVFPQTMQVDYIRVYKN